jgi:hypothetical protein
MYSSWVNMSVASSGSRCVDAREAGGAATGGGGYLLEERYRLSSERDFR